MILGGSLLNFLEITTQYWVNFGTDSFLDFKIILDSSNYFHGVITNSSFFAQEKWQFDKKNWYKIIKKVVIPGGK